MYKWLRSLLFLFPPESVHHFSMFILHLISATRPGRQFIRKAFSRNDPSLRQTFAGLSFKNHIGLAAGFDKNALYLQSLETLGFGFIEIGTVTPLAQAGNTKPRLFRLKKDSALINRMGFNNHGADIVAERLKKWREKPAESGNGQLRIGGNIGKNKITPNEDAWKDLNRKHDQLKPLMLKIAPDLEISQLNGVIDLALEIKLDGLVVSNTSISREGLETSAEDLKRIGAGGLSGKPLQKKSTEFIRYVAEKKNHRITIIGYGGIFSQADAKEKMQAGAGLVQVWTGFIYEGPMIVKKILKGG